MHAEQVFSMATRIGSPKPIPGITNFNGQTRYSTAVGLLLFREEQLKEMPHRQKSDNIIAAYLMKLWQKLSKYFQKEL